MTPALRAVLSCCMYVLSNLRDRSPSHNMSWLFASLSQGFCIKLVWASDGCVDDVTVTVVACGQCHGAALRYVTLSVPGQVTRKYWCC